ncbi:MAG: hypothetical protein ACP5PV_08040 [Methanothrix sp.]
MNRNKSIGFVLVALLALSIVPAALAAEVGDECLGPKISVTAGDPISLKGSPWSTTYYNFAWSSTGFTLTKNGVGLDATAKAAEQINFDAPITPGYYKVTLRVNQVGYDPSLTSCVDEICVQIHCLPPTCPTMTPFCEDNTNPTYTAPTMPTGTTYAWYEWPDTATIPSTLPTAFSTASTAQFPEYNIDPSTHPAYRDYYVYLVMTYAGQTTTCGPTLQKVLTDPAAAIAKV